MAYHSLTNESGGDANARANEAIALLGMIEDSALIVPSEQKFVAEMRERVEQYGSKVMVSTKQLFWLRDIKDKYL